jgi:hypothetical protein
MGFLRRAALVAILSIISVAAPGAQQKAIVMTGDWEHHAEPTLFTGRWEVAIDEERADGTLSGTLSYWGQRCNARGAPMGGRRSDKKLVLEARIGVCGKGTFDLEEVAPGRYAGRFAIDDAGRGEKKATLAAK